MDKVCIVLRTLANGINPDTGVKLAHFISVHSKTKSAYLLKLANEIENMDEEINRRNKKKKAASERSKSLFWSEEKINQLTNYFKSGKSIPNVALDTGRSEAAIAYRLIFENIAPTEHILSLLSEATKKRTLEIIENNNRRKNKIKD